LISKITCSLNMTNLRRELRSIFFLQITQLRSGMWPAWD